MLTYNRRQFIRRAIESVLAQTFCDFEFIIIDNGSNDASGEIADEYAQLDGRIRVIHRERGNIGSGRNTGLDAAIGEYISFVDDDDYCEPDFLDFLYRLNVDNNTDISICGYTKWENGVGTPVGTQEKLVMDSEKAIEELLWRKRYNTAFITKLIRRSLFHELRFPVEGKYEDIYLMYKILARADRIVSYGIPKYNVMRHDGNNSLATEKHDLITPEFLQDYRAAYRERTLWLCGRYPNNSDCWWYFDCSFMISMVEKINRYGLADCNSHLVEMKCELVKKAEMFMKNPRALDFEKEWMCKYVLDREVFADHCDAL
jgi:glycosyltransferase involved in cell wall biosynthesis